MEMIELKNISKRFSVEKKSFYVLKDVSFTLPNHGFIVIEGASGSGKSTLLKILAGLLLPTSGKYFYRGSSLYNNKYLLPNFRNREVGMLFQNYQLVRSLTPLENVAFPLLIRRATLKDAKEQASLLFKRFHLEHKMHCSLDTLSGGEKQRIAFLRALIVNPSFLLCDEPTGALDEENARLLLEALKEISKEKLVVVVTHNPMVSKRYGDQRFLLKEGALYAH